MFSTYFYIIVLLSCVQVKANIDERMQILEAGLKELAKENGILASRIKEIEETSASNLVEESNRSKRQPTVQTIGFTASVGGVVKLTNIGSHQIIKFDSYVTNIGNGYDRATGIFRAPVAGLYAFTVDIMVDPGYEADLHIIKESYPGGYQTTLTALYADARTTNTFASSSRSFVINLNRNDQVWARNGFTTTIELHGNGFTTFTGYLLHSTI